MKFGENVVPAPAAALYRRNIEKTISLRLTHFSRSNWRKFGAKRGEKINSNRCCDTTQDANQVNQHREWREEDGNRVIVPPAPRPLYLLQDDRHGVPAEPGMEF